MPGGKGRSSDWVRRVAEVSVAGPSLGVLLFVAQRAIEQRVLAALHAAGFDDTTVAQGRVFARIGESGTRLTDLAEMAQVTKQTAAFLVDRLERSGYVERVPDPTDARARLVRISSADREEQAVYTEWEQHLGARDLERLTEIMGRLREVTDPYRDLDPPGRE
jgi:DNA-binding MarR family transcriptional regulator